MAQEAGNQTPDTPPDPRDEPRDETRDETRDEIVEQLRQEAKDAGVLGTADMRKDELVREVARLRSRQGRPGSRRDENLGDAR